MLAVARSGAFVVPSSTGGYRPLIKPQSEEHLRDQEEPGSR
jgi:hypothetical protein